MKRVRKSLTLEGTMKDLRFDLYRYSILPRDRFQSHIFEEENLSRKNDIFLKIIQEVNDFSTERIKIISKCIFDKDEFLLLLFAVNRSLKRETKDFNEELIETWPKFNVAIWNNPDKQIIAVQERTEAFQYTKIVMNNIASVINEKFIKDGLLFVFEPLFCKDDFWNIVKKYKKEIKEVEFELVTPNIARIAETLSDQFKDFAKRTNTIRSKINIASDQDASLNISQEDSNLEGLVHYASEGGGSITVKVASLRKSLKTSDSIRTIELRDTQISGNTPEELASILRGLMDV